MKSKRNRIFDEFGGTAQFPWEFKIGHTWEYVHIHPRPKRPSYYRVFVNRRGEDEVCIAGSENRAQLLPVIVDALRGLDIIGTRNRFHKAVLWRLGFWATH